MSEPRSEPTEEIGVAGPDPGDAAASPAPAAPPSDPAESGTGDLLGTVAAAEPVEAAPAPERADPLAAGLAVAVLVALLACAAIVLIAAGNA